MIDGDPRLADREPAAQDAAARGLEHRRLHAPVAQHRARANRPRVVPGGDQRAVEEQTVGAVVAGAPAVRASAGGDQPHGRGLAVRAGDDGGRHVMQRRPADVGHGRQRVERQVDVAVARTQRQHLVVEQPRQIARVSGVDQREQVAGAPPSATRCRSRVIAAASSSTGGMAGGVAESAASRIIAASRSAQRSGIACQQRRRQCPLVELGRGEELVQRRGDGERCAVGVHARDRGQSSPGDRAHGRPAEIRPRRARHARASRRAAPHRARRRRRPARRQAHRRTGCCR